jgi:hypothetical protein
VSTVYRVVVHCDAQAGPDCAGFTELASASVTVTDAVVPALATRGWHRGYGPQDTSDTCPACAARLGLPSPLNRTTPPPTIADEPPEPLIVVVEAPGVGA